MRFVVEMPLLCVVVYLRCIVFLPAFLSFVVLCLLYRVGLDFSLVWGMLLVVKLRDSSIDEIRRIGAGCGVC